MIILTHIILDVYSFYLTLTNAAVVVVIVLPS